MFLASDANPDALAEMAWRAGRKPTRGGVSNLICIAEPLDVLSAELGTLADHITVILPWGSLLRAVANPEIDPLRNIARLCLSAATVEVVFSYDEQRDARRRSLFGPEGLDEEHITRVLPGRYDQAGLTVLAAEEIPQRALANYKTTWGKRLAFGQPRKVWRIRARHTSRGRDAWG